ncbi:MAG: hypothetical protein CVV64_19010 [Candidatus Wallbacteria bacterium HGW-Wallbacteria-1]|uniref:Uncharacterized protein n=1 Tax=Candidatus Wallbacteria bacterium HGW-Wallbacteria-1 TaxID=2013854 RepID=A0A2N1PJ48_9BACT|nr:MAG: hypothetical protein CVV64_19010 [Candidatus Wallbacteria bacterium HGW-Wallbacteria-1]
MSSRVLAVSLIFSTSGISVRLFWPRCPAISRYTRKFAWAWGKRGSSLAPVRKETLNFSLEVS